MAEPRLDPTFVGGQPPSQVPPTEQVADDQQRSVEKESFVINAPAVKHAGESDIKKMIMNAFFEARKRKLPSGQADIGLYEKNIDVLLSRGEVVVPPEIARIIGYDKLRKINNRGKKEVEKLEQVRQQQGRSLTPEQQALGMRFGSIPSAQHEEIREKFNEAVRTYENEKGQTVEVLEPLSNGENKSAEVSESLSSDDESITQFIPKNEDSFRLGTVSYTHLTLPTTPYV